MLGGIRHCERAKGKNMWRATLLPSAFCLGVILLLNASAAVAQSVASFYQGRQVEFIVAAEAGSIYDTWARLLARHMPKHMPGNPAFVIKNMPGGGHIRAAGYSFNAAPKDGSSIVTFSHNIPASYMLRNPAITFDVGKFQWLGSPDLPGRMCVVRPGAKVQKAADLFEHELWVGGAGAGGGISQTPKLVSGLLGMKMKLVEGYKGGGDALLAVERGEVDGMCATVEGIENERGGWVAQGKLKPLFNMERKPIAELGVPSIFEFAKTEEDRQILGFYGSTMEFGFPAVAPPGVPADRVNALRRAHDAAVKDPAFLSEVARAKMKSVPVTGEELTQRMDELIATPTEIIRRTSSLIGGNPF
jgi:tripartite-type tricarboxylate transporter receptor subunit TctC